MPDSTNLGAIGFASTLASANYALYGTSANTTLNAPGGTLSFAAANTPIMRLSATGGFSIGNIYVSTDPGLNNLIIQGSVGIGTMNPRSALDVVSGSLSTSSAFMENSSTASGIAGLTVKLDSAALNSTSHFLNFLNANGVNIGSIQANGATGVTYATQGIGDFAEWMRVSTAGEQGLPLLGQGETLINSGTIVCQGSDGVFPCTASDSAKMVGVVSAHPSFLGGTETAESVKVGFMGQIPVKIQDTRYQIQGGDPITIDPDNPGYGIRATARGYIAGIAVSDRQPDGTVLVKIDPGWHEEPDTGQSLSLGETSFASLAAQGVKQGVALLGWQGNALNISSLSAELATISGNLTVLGQTQLGNTSIGGSLQVGLLHIDDIRADISSLTGQVTITSNLSVAGDATVSGQLSVGKGIVLTDTMTGEKYCVQMSDGEMVKKKGACGQ